MPNPHKTADTACALIGTVLAVAAIGIAITSHTAPPSVALLGALALFFFICAVRHWSSWGNRS